MKFAFATAILKIETLRMRRRFARVSLLLLVFPSLILKTPAEKLVRASHSPICFGPISEWLIKWGKVFGLANHTGRRNGITKLAQITFGTHLKPVLYKAELGKLIYKTTNGNR